MTPTQLPLFDAPASPYLVTGVESVNDPHGNTAALVTVADPRGRLYPRCRLLLLPDGRYTLAGPRLSRFNPARGRTDYRTGLLNLRQDMADRLAADALAALLPLLLAREGGRP